MKIGFFSGSYFPRKDGCSYTVREWKRRLEARGHETFIIYPSSRSYEPGENEIPVRSVNNPWFQGHMWPMPVGTRKFPELDIVHCHSQGPLGMMGRYYAWRNSIPAVYTHHTPLEDYAEGLFNSDIISRVLGKIYVTLETRYMDTFDVITSNTPDIDRDVETVELPVGIDTEFFRPVKTDFFEGMEAKRPVIGYSGRISEEKNLENVVELGHGFEGTIVIAGEGRYREELEEKAPENVKFLDFLPREDLPRFMSSLDVFVTASTSDTLCLSALEANACGTPVVAPDVPPFNRTIDGSNGLNYSYGDQEDFLEKITKCTETGFDPRSRAKDYSVDKTIERLEEIYQGLLN